MVLKASRVQLAGHLRRLFCRVWLRIEERRGEAGMSGYLSFYPRGSGDGQVGAERRKASLASLCLTQTCAERPVLAED